jgi:hypothetical protein
MQALWNKSYGIMVVSFRGSIDLALEKLNTAYSFVCHSSAPASGAGTTSQLDQRNDCQIPNCTQDGGECGPIAAALLTHLRVEEVPAPVLQQGDDAVLFATRWGSAL